MFPCILANSENGKVPYAVGQERDASVVAIDVATPGDLILSIKKG